jgi:hypothetical protein
MRPRSETNGPRRRGGPCALPEICGPDRPCAGGEILRCAQDDRGWGNVGLHRRGRRPRRPACASPAYVHGRPQGIAPTRELVILRSDSDEGSLSVLPCTGGRSFGSGFASAQDDTGDGGQETRGGRCGLPRQCAHCLAMTETDIPACPRAHRDAPHQREWRAAGGASPALTARTVFSPVSLRTVAPSIARRPPRPVIANQ